MTKRYWFGPKQYGIGYSPASWEGWLATAFFIGLLIGSIQLLRHLIADHLPGQLMMVSLVLLLETGLFLWLIASRTEGSFRWRWGNDKSH
jgi:hypothetical protein